MAVQDKGNDSCFSCKLARNKGLSAGREANQGHDKPMEDAGELAALQSEDHKEEYEQDGQEDFEYLFGTT